MMRGKPGYEHLNEPLHILVEGELPVEIVDARLMQAREILEDLLKPVVNFTTHLNLSAFAIIVCSLEGGLGGHALGIFGRRSYFSFFF